MPLKINMISKSIGGAIIPSVFNQQYVTSGANLGILTAHTENWIRINFILILSSYDDLGLASDMSEEELPSYVSAI